MKWIDAIIEVLKTSKDAMHYVDIANEIMSRKLREECKTPHISVHVIMNAHQDIFLKDSKSKYRLNPAFDYKNWQKNSTTTDKDENKVIEAQITKTNNTTIIKAYGRMWERNRVEWKCHPVLLGTPRRINKYIDFNKMRGVYMLYNSKNEMIYVGLATNGIGDRLREHTKDKLADHWTKFSWFGIDGIKQDGSIRRPTNLQTTISDVASALESVVIIGLQPPRNIKNGERMKDKEYLQY
ncbi:MAG: hypothetical protein E7149_01785 [Rikenellaceae bacterium]|nr:hypothetical protein [Rikenellaceae bacterium]